MLKFETVLEGLKNGKFFSREGMMDNTYVGMQVLHELPTKMTTVLPHLYLCTPKKTEEGIKFVVIPWTPSQADLLAEDWFQTDAQGSRAIAN